MRIFLNLFLVLIFVLGKAQNVPESAKLQEFKNCKTTECKIVKSFLLAEYFLETDDIQSSQKWLNFTKDLVSPKQSDTTIVFIHSLQSELFYYDGLFQFGNNEAEKAIQKAKQLKDNLLIANGYFFKGINQIEMNQLQEAEKSLWKARDYQPENYYISHIRSPIQNEHIFNNISQFPFSYLLHTAIIWICYLAMFALPFQALDATSQLSSDAILLGFIAGSLGITFTNGGIGTYPLLVGLVVAFYIGDSHPEGQAVGNALGMLIWTSQTILMILLGLLSLVLLPRNYSKEAENEPSELSGE